MIPQGIELRQEWGVGHDVLMVGFSEPDVDDVVAMSILIGPFLDYVANLAETTPLRTAVVDMRNVASLSSTGMGKFLSLTSRLKSASWRMILVIDDPVLRGVLAETHLNRIIRIVRGANLDQVLQSLSANTALSQPSEDPGAFTRREIDEIMAAGITLDDAIRDLQRLRT